MLNLNVIIIPVYKSTLSEFELISLNRCLKILCNHDICLITIKELELCLILDVFKKHNIVPYLELFENTYFEGIYGYNRLMLSFDFYDRFKRYKYMLIYQLDAYVFRDELDYWCNQEYDYIGAPSPSEIKEIVKTKYKNDFDRDIDSNFSIYNGGLSLRKINSFSKIIQENKFYIDELLKNDWYEDVIFSKLLYEREEKLLPSNEMAVKFSFECFPSRLYLSNNRQLPMGCHAWYRNEGGIYDDWFWFKHIRPFYYYKLRFLEKLVFFRKKNIRRIKRILKHIFNYNA